jgi:hypothetical protein
LKNLRLYDKIILIIGKEAEMLKIYRNCLISILFIGFLINISAWEQQSLDGVWLSNTTGYLEELGFYDLNHVLTIQYGKYTLIYERTSKNENNWSFEEKGSLIILDNEILFYREEYKTGEIYLLWEVNEYQIIICNFLLNNNILTINNGKNVIIFIKQ